MPAIAWTDTSSSTDSKEFPKASRQTALPKEFSQPEFLFHPTISKDEADGAGAYRPSKQPLKEALHEELEDGTFPPVKKTLREVLEDSDHEERLPVPGELPSSSEKLESNLKAAKDYLRASLAKEGLKTIPEPLDSIPSPLNNSRATPKMDPSEGSWVYSEASDSTSRPTSRPAPRPTPRPISRHPAYLTGSHSYNGYSRRPALAPHQPRPHVVRFDEDWLPEHTSNPFNPQPQFSRSRSQHTGGRVPVTPQYPTNYQSYAHPTSRTPPDIDPMSSARKEPTRKKRPDVRESYYPFPPKTATYFTGEHLEELESDASDHDEFRSQNSSFDHDSDYDVNDREIPKTRGSQATTKNPIRSSTYRILCEIKCHKLHDEDDAGAIHRSSFFEDVPYWNKRFKKTTPHLTGCIPVYNLKSYLASSNGLFFLVIREYSCSYTLSQYNVTQGIRAWPSVRVRDDEQKEFTEHLEIVSESLQMSIKKVSKCQVDCFTGLSSPRRALECLEFESPYLFLYHHRSLLSELAKNEAEVSRREILALLIYLKQRQKTTYGIIDAMFAKSMTDATSLDYLFCPNEIVVSSRSGIEVAYAIRYVHFYADGSLQLNCWAWVFDGTHLKRRTERINVSCKGSNPIKITDLDAYPLRFATEETKARLLKRGARFWELRTPQLATYMGMNFLQEKYISEGRCMLDFPTYRMMHRDAEIFTQRSEKPLEHDSFPEKISKDANLTDEQMMLCPPNIHGYLLREKKWVNLLVDNVFPVTWNKDAFKRLVLPNSTKDLVEALIKAHASANWQHGGLVSGKRLDLIAGKGRGLIMLLHGSPGTGKTLTAESVAEIAEMPLYSVTCGDIGIQVEQVERYLETVLYLGKHWNCVLLLDEADVFLEERSLSDIQRNSLVSVFLRILEYYEGILILTSNRVGTFDEAFRSRIQLALHYPKLTPTFRKKIWQNFFDMLAEDKEDVDLAELGEHLEELSKREMNGREIRNALTSARQLAAYKRVTLQWKHLQETLSIGKVFVDYLSDVHGHADEDWAREERLR